MRFTRHVSKRFNDVVAPKPVPHKVRTESLEASWKALERRNLRTPGYPNVASSLAKELIDRDDVCPKIKAQAEHYLLERSQE